MAANEPKPKPLEFYGGSQVYSESGVDLSLLRENLEKTIEERWDENRRAALFAETLRLSQPPGKRRASQPLRRQSLFNPEALVRRLADHLFHDVAVAQAAAGVKRVIDVVFKAVFG